MTLREILERVFDLIPRFKSRDELLEEEFDKFVAGHPPDNPESCRHAGVLQAYAANDRTRSLVDSKAYADLTTNPSFTLDDLRRVPAAYRFLDTRVTSRTMFR